MTLICVRFCALGATVGRSLQHSRARILSCFKGRTARRDRRSAVTLFVARPVFCEKQAFPGERGINQSWGSPLAASELRAAASFLWRAGAATQSAGPLKPREGTHPAVLAPEAGKD